MMKLSFLPFDMLFLFSMIFIVCVFFFVIGMVVFIFVRNASAQKKNDNAPKLKVPASVVSKRTRVSGKHSFTTYYVTFQVESGDRMELQLSGTEFGMLVEGDSGKLTFQGTRYLSFERH